MEHIDPNMEEETQLTRDQQDVTEYAVVAQGPEDSDVGLFASR